MAEKRNAKPAATEKQPVQKKNSWWSNRPLRFQIALIMGVLGFLLYANTFRNGYAVDDGTVVSYNSYTTQGLKSIPAIFTSSYRAGENDPSKKERVLLYRPLSVAMFAAEWQVSPGNPHLSHVVNAILYGVTGFLLFLVLGGLWSLRSGKPAFAGVKADGKKEPGQKREVKSPAKFFAGPLLVPAIITLLFVTHPVHTEVAGNIKGADELLSFLFVLASFRFVIRYFERESARDCLLAAVPFFFALLSKESAITVVAVVPLLGWFFDPKFSLSKALKTAAALASAAAVYLIIRSVVLHGFMSSSDILALNNSLVTAPDLVSRLATAIMILGRYLLLLVFPLHLSFDYSLRQIPIVGLADPAALLSLAVYGGLVLYALLGFRKRDPISFAVLFFVVTISIVSNIVFLIESVMGERFLYMPSLGFCIGAGILLERLVMGRSGTDRGKARLLLTIGIAIAAVFSIRTVVRNFDWLDDYTLSGKDVQTCPNSARIQYAYGSYVLVGKALKETDPAKKLAYVNEVIDHLEKAVALFPDFSRAYYHLGVAYKEKGDFARAVYNLEQAKKFDNFREPDFFMASGMSYAGLKQYDKAIAEFRTAASLNPQLAPAYINIGIDYDAMGRYGEAMEAFNQALGVDSKSWDACFNIGNTFSHMGRYPDAIEWYKRALSINNRCSDAYNNMGIVYATLKDYNNAYECFKGAVSVNPGSAQAQGNLRQVSALLGK